MTKGNPNNTPNGRSGIGTLTEKSLHSTLIQWFAKPGDKLESNFGGYIIDIIHNNILIEIQIKNFSIIKPKLLKLCKDYQVRLIHPITRQKWIIKEETNGQRISKRKSPKRGRIEEIFYELIRIPDLLINPNFSLWVVIVDIEEIWLNDGKGSWRRKYWSILDRHLLDVIALEEFNQSKDYLDLLPHSLPKAFTNKDVASNLEISKSLARRITYCLRKMNAIKIISKQGREYLFSIS